MSDSNRFFEELEQRLNKRTKLEKEAFIIQNLKEHIEKYYIIDEYAKTNNLQHLTLYLQKILGVDATGFKYEYEPYLNKLNIHRVMRIKDSTCQDERQGWYYRGVGIKDKEGLVKYLLENGIKEEKLRQVRLIPGETKYLGFGKGGKPRLITQQNR